LSDLLQIRSFRKAAPPPAPAAAEGATTAASGAQRLAYVETYGCQMNVADTEMVLGLLHRDGYARTDDVARADLILINTCAVREKAEDRVFQRASMLAEHKARPGVVLGITGCMAEHLKDKIRARAPHVDLVVGPDGYRRLLEHVREVRDARSARDPGAGVEDTVLDRHETY
jgi:tRNA-2-methylthio-N6-dimethylallyladenosine synthase